MRYENLAVILLGTLSGNQTDSINRNIAAFLLENADQAAHMKLSEIADACHVANSSISRFCKDAGFNDFSELKEMLDDFRASYTPVSGSDLREKGKAYISTITEAMSAAAFSLSEAALRRLCRDIHDYSNIYILGHLKAHAAVIALQCDLLQMGKFVQTAVPYRDHLAILKNAGPDDLIIVFSFTGSYFHMPETRKLKDLLIYPKIWMIHGGSPQQPSFVNGQVNFSSDHKKTGNPFALEITAAMIADTYYSMFCKDRTNTNG